MGHRVPPISTRIGLNKGFDPIWYSDLHFSLLLQKDMTSSKYARFLIHRYYKHKVRFLRGKHRRRRPTLRVASVICKRFYEKTVLNLFNYRQSKKSMKYSLFIPLYKKNNKKKKSIATRRGLFTFYNAVYKKNQPLRLLKKA
jgi:hypothetical protein